METTVVREQDPLKVRQCKEIKKRGTSAVARWEGSVRWNSVFPGAA